MKYKTCLKILEEWYGSHDIVACIHLIAKELNIENYEILDLGTAILEDENHETYHTCTIKIEDETRMLEIIENDEYDTYERENTCRLTELIIYLDNTKRVPIDEFVKFADKNNVKDVMYWESDNDIHYNLWNTEYLGLIADGKWINIKYSECGYEMFTSAIFYYKKLELLRNILE